MLECSAGAGFVNLSVLRVLCKNIFFQIRYFLKNIKKFPYPSSAKMWETDEKCYELRNLLLPHYFNPRGDGIDHEKIITDLLSGISNSMEWREDIGLEIDRTTYGKPFTGLVSQLRT